MFRETRAKPYVIYLTEFYDPIINPGDMNNPFSRTVIIADGSFPVHGIPLAYIRNAARLICCDGSTRSIVNAGFQPDAIIGDMDSLEEELAIRFAGRLFPDADQETNDLTKAVKWCSANGYDDVVITGASGKREDHTIGNISLLADYAAFIKVLMVTDTGFFFPVNHTMEINSFPGQQVSVFSIDCCTEITSRGLRYPLKKKRLTNWWQATLNESMGDTFSLEFNEGKLIVFLKFSDE